MNFSYTAVNARGEKKSGLIEAPTEGRALDLLDKRGLVTIKIKQHHGAYAQHWWQKDIIRLTALVSKRDLATYFETFSNMASAKLPLTDILKFTIQTTKNMHLRSALERIQSNVSEGQSLFKAMQKHPTIFNQQFLSLVKMGEQSNTLEETTKNCADLLRSEADSSSQIRSALIYPVILFVMSSIVLGIVLFQLIPTLMPMFQQSDRPIPTSLAVLDSLRLLLQNYWLTTLIIFMVITMATIWIVKSKPGFIERFLFSLPKIGSFLKDKHSYTLTRSLGLLLSTGVPLSQAIEATRDSMTSPTFQSLLFDTNKALIDGGQMSEIISNSSLLNPVISNLVVTGERGNNLSQMMISASDMLFKTQRTSLDRAVKLITPALTLIIGLLVGGVILTTVSAIMEVNSLVF